MLVDRESFLRRRSARLLVVAALLMLSCFFLIPSRCSSNSQLAPSGSSFEEVTYKTGNLTIVVSTDVGVFSPYVQHTLREHAELNGLGRETLVGLLACYFAATGAVQSPNDFMLALGPTLEKYGYGHALPIIAAVAIENLLRPTPSPFEQATSGLMATANPAIVRVVVHRSEKTFLACARNSHSSARAYYNPRLNEVGLLLDMAMFRTHYGHLESLRGSERMIIPAFVAFLEGQFSTQCAHEVSHAVQDLCSASCFSIPFISEGEATRQGFVRRRRCLQNLLLYDLFYAYAKGRYDGERIRKRLDIVHAIGDPPLSPTEVRRLREIRHMAEHKRLKPVSESIVLSPDGFYSGSAQEVRERFLQAWVTCSVAMRSTSAREALQRVMADAFEHRPIDAGASARVDGEVSQFLATPVRANLSSKQMWEDAEQYWSVDEPVSGVFYQWIYSTDDTDHRALVYLGDTLLHMGYFIEAREMYEAAARLTGGSVLTIGRLADVFARCGQRESAKAGYLEALRVPSCGPSDDAYKEWVKVRLRELDGPIRFP